MTLFELISGVMLRSLRFSSYFYLLRYYRLSLSNLAVFTLSISLAVYQLVLEDHLTIEHLQYGLLLKEIFFGVSQALGLIIFFELLTLFFKLFDIIRGVFIAEQQFPFVVERQSTLEVIASYLISILYFSLGVYQHSLENLICLSNEISFSALMISVLRQVSVLFSTALKLLSPFMFIILSLDFSQAYLGKILPRVNFSLEFQAVKLVLLFFLIYLFLDDNVLELFGILSGLSGTP